MASLRRAILNTHRLFKLSDLSARSVSNVTSSHSLLIRPQYKWVSHFTTDSAAKGFNQSLDIDLSNEESKRRLFNRLLYRSRQRGFLELDLVLGNWVEGNIQSLDVNGINALLHVLDLENPDLWKWLTDQEQPPEAVKTNPVFTAIRKKVVSNLDNHAAPQTRALPGQPWVRGWDDIKKGQDGPIAGNQ